jgi:hypothetical protein
MKDRQTSFENELQSKLAKEKENIKIVMEMFNATFNNISVISWLSVLLVEETSH